MRDIPLAVSLSGGNRNDITEPAPLEVQVPSVAGLVGGPLERRDTLFDDRGDYDHDTCLVWQRAIKPLIARRGVPQESGSATAAQAAAKGDAESVPAPWSHSPWQKSTGSWQLAARPNLTVRSASTPWAGRSGDADTRPSHATATTSDGSSRWRGNPARAPQIDNPLRTLRTTPLTRPDSEGLLEY